MVEQMLVKEIKSSNLVIAEFMGGVLHKNWASKIYPDLMDTIIFPTGSIPTLFSSALWSPSQLLYHESWDWLMPVVEKIENQRARIIIDKESCVIMFDIVFPYGFETFQNEGSKIEQVYKAIFEYIKWFNTQNSKEV